MSPSERTVEAPLCTSTPYAPRTIANGHDAADGVAHVDIINGNVNVNIVSESIYSMDVLSGGESDAGDTLRRQNNNNNSISSNLTNTIRDGTIEAPKRRGADLTYFIAKELLMTERTYKRDLELVTVTWSGCVSELAAEGVPEVAGLARACLALEPLALACGALLARLERALASNKLNAQPDVNADDNEEPEYKKVPEILHEYLSNTYDAYERYTENSGTLVGLVESVRRRSEAARNSCARFETQAPLPLACLLLRPLHRLLHYETIATELWSASGGESARLAQALARRAAQAARRQLPHAENHAALCQLQRDLVGYDKLLVADREFIRLGCVYKHSTRGLQQRMLFLFNDVLLVSSRAAGAQFRAHSALPLSSIAIRESHLPHSFEIEGEDVHLLISASNEQEYLGWIHALTAAIADAKENPVEVDTELTSVDHDTENSPCIVGSCGGALTQVCWHRAAALPRPLLHRALQTQLSGYLLRKFKKSPGWQKLWVVFAVFTMFFYKSWQDPAPLASLPLLGYNVAAPEPDDGIDKDFVFKLQFKKHVYLFRADSIFTYNRWVDVLKAPMMRYDHN